jgi:hypothetical protein
MINKSDQSNFIHIGLEDVLKYEVTSLIPIESYFRTGCQTFERQKNILRKLISSIWYADKYLLDTNKVILDKSYIFIDASTLNVKLLYLPLCSFEINIHKQMREILLSLLFTIDIKIIESDNRMKQMITYLQDVDFDIMAFDSMIKSIKSEPIKQKKEWFKQIFMKEVDPIIPSADRTILLEEEESFPVLEFKEKSIIVNKRSFLIGRAKQLVDYAIPEALSLGRVHAEVIKEKDSYYIIDINTKNGTFVNGERIESQKKYPIVKGDCIHIAKEKVIFK